MSEFRASKRQAPIDWTNPRTRKSARVAARNTEVQMRGQLENPLMKVY